MDKRFFDLSVSTYGVTRSQNVDIVLLPWGATEPHNLHLPYMTDCILSHDVAIDAALKAYEVHGLRCMVMPPVTMGSQNPGQRNLKFCIHARYQTQFAILCDIVDSLYNQGFRKLVIINGHGGNNFKNMIRDLSVDYPDFMIACGEWFKMAPVKEYFDEPGDHADEIETSTMMHYHPDLVRIEEAGPGIGHEFTIDALREGKVWLPRNWNLASPEDTGIGNPHLSTAEKGKRFAEAVATAYAHFLHQFSEIEQPKDLYK
ncbi:MAG: creatininase family protein [Prevotella sp.]